MTKEECNNINSWLALKYGRADDGRAKYRLCWTDDLTEMRHGIFLDWYDLIGYQEIEDTRRCPKYSYAPERWVLEKLSLTTNMPPDLVDAKPFDYECVFIFWEGEKGTYIEPNELIIDGIVYYDINRTLRGHAPSETELNVAREKQRAKARENIRERLDDALPELPNALVKGSAIVNPLEKSK